MFESLLNIAIEPEKNLLASFAGESQARNRYTYFASVAKKEDYKQIEALFLETAENEKEHAKKFFKYISSKGRRVAIEGFKNPKNDYDSLLDAFEKSLGHEEAVTKRIYNLMSLAHSEQEYATTSFLQWFIDEQVEEEESVSNIISKIKIVKDTGLYLLDQEVAQRTFVPPVK